MTNKKDFDVNLDTLQAYFDELKLTLDRAKGFKSLNVEGEEINKLYLLELSKCAGLLFGLQSEATMLIGDFSHLIKCASSPGGQSLGTDDFINSIFQTTLNKKSGTNN